MTTKHIEDISHKRFVPTKYMPNSYRIFCEDIGNDSLKDEHKYQSQAPPIFTQPMIVPAQAIEDRNNPHAGRHATFLRENAHTLNEPVNKISSKNLQADREIEKRWWEWNMAVNTSDDLKKKGKRSKSNAAPSESAGNTLNGNILTNGNKGDSSGFQTTYQKDHGYLKDFMANNGNKQPVSTNMGQNEFHSSATRHAANPNSKEAVGIVPVNELNGFTRPGDEQRVYLDKMSFEHQYDARKDTNYPNVGKRQGAFVLEQIQPRTEYGLKSRNDSSNGTSLWDLMHPDNSKAKGKTSSNKLEQTIPVLHVNDPRNQRRDPIGYFSDMKYGDKVANGKSPAMYQPTWNGSGNGHRDEQFEETGNELIDRAMMYQNQKQQPMTANGFENN